MAEVALLHVHAQEFWHDNAYLIGNRAGLEKLRRAIDEALTDGTDFRDLTTADGEGYKLVVMMDNSDWQGDSWTRALLPYTDSAARDDRPHVVYPGEHKPQVKEDTHADG